MEKKTKDFFISYNKNDKEYAEWIAYILEENNYSTVIQEWDFKVGNNFILEMETGSKISKQTILVLSKSYLKSGFTQPEWAQAFVKDPTGEKRTLIPIKVRDCSLDGMLAPIVHINLVNMDEREAEREILRKVSDKRMKPMTRPKFPKMEDRNEKPNFPGEIPQK